MDQEPGQVPVVASGSQAEEKGHVPAEEPHPKKKSRRQHKPRFYIRECKIQDKVVWRIMDRENSNVFMQLSESLGATKILTQELLQLALDGTPKDMLHKMYKQYRAGDGCILE